MINLVGITSKENIHDIPSDNKDLKNSFNSLNFLDILKNQVKDINKPENIDSSNIYEKTEQNNVIEKNEAFENPVHQNQYNDYKNSEIDQKLSEYKVNNYEKNEIPKQKNEKPDLDKSNEQKKDSNNIIESKENSNKNSDKKISDQDSDKKVSVIDKEQLKSDKKNIKNIDELKINELFKNINQLIDILQNTQKKPNTLHEVKISSLDKNESFKNAKINSDNILFKQTISKIKSLLDQINFKDLPNKDALNFNNMLKNLKDLISKLPSKFHKESNIKETDQKESNNIVKNVTAKLESIIENLKSEHSNKSGNGNEEGTAKNNNFNFSFTKNDSANKGIDASPLLQQKNIPFKDQFQSIINNAKIVVKDSRNGTFSVKLYPRELGNININLGLEQGIIHGRFLVDNNEAKEILMQNLAYIKEQLMEAGISVGEFQVNVNHQNNNFFDEDTNKKDTLNKAENIHAVNSEYSINSSSIHNGTINMVI